MGIYPKSSGLSKKKTAFKKQKNADFSKTTKGMEN